MGEIEQEPKLPNCIYCQDYMDVPAIEIIETIDSKQEPVCNMHGHWANAVGLVSNGYVPQEEIDLADYMRDVILDNTLKHFQNTLVHPDK